MNGKQYLDGSSGAVVVNIGHGVKEVIEAAYEQSKKVTFTFRNTFTNEPLEKLASRLVEKAPGMAGIFFVNSGSEATEAGLRLASQYWQEVGKPEKQKILSRTISYHGITLGALGLTGHHGRRSRYLHLLKEHPSIENPYCYRCPFGKKPGFCSLECAYDLEEKINQIGADKIAGFIAEPVVGAAGGAITPPDSYYQKIREICNKYNFYLLLTRL